MPVMFAGQVMIVLWPEPLVCLLPCRKIVFTRAFMKNMLSLFEVGLLMITGGESCFFYLCMYLFLFSTHVFEDNLSCQFPNIICRAAPWECTYLCVRWGLSGCSDSSGLRQSSDLTDLTGIRDAFLFPSITVISIKWLLVSPASRKSGTISCTLSIEVGMKLPQLQTPTEKGRRYKICSMLRRRLTLWKFACQFTTFWLISKTGKKPWP